MHRTLRGVLGVSFAVVFVATACGKSTSSEPATTAASTTSRPEANSSTGGLDVTQITANWKTFFAGSTGAEQKIALLQDGRSFADTIHAQANSVMAKGTTAQVLNVSALAPGRARVQYTILLNGTPALKNQIGLAVLDGSVWKVADSSFCALLALEGTKPAACASGDITPSPTT